MMIAGCSKPTQQETTAIGKRAVSDAELASRKLEGDATDAQLREAGFRDKDIEVFRYLQGKNWRKGVVVDPMDGHRDVSFSLFAQPIYDGWQSNRDIGVELMVPCKTDIDVIAKTNDVPDSHVRLRFDDGPVQSEEWHVAGKMLLETHSREFVHHLLAAKAMNFEYRPESFGSAGLSSLCVEFERFDGPGAYLQVSHAIELRCVATASSQRVQNSIGTGGDHTAAIP